MTTVCPVCRGEGIIGVGDQPHLRQGPLSTCPNCGGTGKVESVEVVVAPTVETQTPSSSGNEVANTSVESAPENAKVAPVDSEVVVAPVEGVTIEVVSEPVQ